jgi:hypothetical protein
MLMKPRPHVAHFPRTRCSSFYSWLSAMRLRINEQRERGMSFFILDYSWLARESYENEKDQHNH